MHRLQLGQPDAGEASGQLLPKFAPPNDAMRVPQKYFFIPSARFREVYAADVSPSDAQFIADSQQQLAESFGGTCLCGVVANQAQLRRPDDPGSCSEPPASTLDVSALRCQGYRGRCKPRCFCFSASDDRSSYRDCGKSGGLTFDRPDQRFTRFKAQVV
jgi:hypothetical protein